MLGFGWFCKVSNVCQHKSSTWYMIKTSSSFCICTSYALYILVVQRNVEPKQRIFSSLIIFLPSYSFCRKQLELQCLSHFRSFKSLFVEFICLCHSFPSFPLSPKLQFYSKCAEKSPLGPDSYLNQRHRPKKWKRSERGEADY